MPHYPFAFTERWWAADSLIQLKHVFCGVSTYFLKLVAAIGCDEIEQPVYIKAKVFS